MRHCIRCGLTDMQEEFEDSYTDKCRRCASKDDFPLTPVVPVVPFDGTGFDPGGTGSGGGDFGGFGGGDFGGGGAGRDF